MQPEAIFNAPIPGSSLTKDPDSRGPWEMPPKFSSVNQAIDHLFRTVTSETFIRNYDVLMSEDKRFYVDELAVQILMEGFMNGLWTPDMMLLLVEPLMIMMIWAAAQLDRSPTFSNDTGYEDRTGFESIMEMLDDDQIPEGPVDTPEEPTEAPEAPESPLVSNIPQSPLTGGM